MNKQEYLNALKQALLGLGEEEIKKSIDFYAEIIDDAVENGETEADAVARLGSVAETAQKIINETPLAKLVRENVKRRKWSTAEIVLLILGSPVWLPVLIAIIAAAFSLYCVLWAVSVSLFAVFGSMALTGVVLAAAAPFIALENVPKAMVSFGAGLAAIGSSVFVFWVSAAFSKQILRLTTRLIKRAKEKFMGKGGETR